MNEAKRNFLLMFALSIVFAGLAGFLLLQKLRSIDRQYGERVQVVVAKQAIPPKTPITPDMLETIEVPGQFAVPSAVGTPAEAAGQISLIPIQKGDFMTKTMLKKIPATGDSLRLVNLTQSERVLFDEPLDATDHVDIVVSLQEEEKPVTKLLLENVPIGRVLSDKERQRAIGVELSMEDAQKLIFMQNFSHQIRVLKHPVVGLLR
jgi:pilus assembly protein CpaB